MKWILIIMLHGWGSGVGSDGNVVTSVEFTTKAKCIVAAEWVLKSSSKETTVMCFEK